MTDIYQEIVAELNAGRSLVLATVVKRRGSAPRGMGAKMIIRQDGSTFGTVGGGCLEAQTMDDAAEAVKTDIARVIKFDLMGDEATSAGMICGGMVDVYVEYLRHEDTVTCQTMNILADCSKVGRPAAVAVTLDQQQPNGQRFIWVERGVHLDPEQDWPAELADYASTHPNPDAIKPKNLGEHYVEPVRMVPTVYIFGAGHVSSQIVPLAAMVDFKVVVMDDRSEFASPDRFPTADQVISAPFEELVANLDMSPATYAVIVTRGHDYDHYILEKILPQPAAYIGMIGSRRKRNAIYDDLLTKGFTQQDLDRVHSPIGLDIKAETPEEIAVSIVAELIRARAEATKAGKKKNWFV